MTSSKKILSPEQRQELSGYDFCFENIVFEGGGNKGLAAVGAVRVLEELGYWGNIKRFAGASAGSMVAALLAVGYDSHHIEGFLREDISDVFLDARFGQLSYLPNMLSEYGLHPGRKIFDWFGEKFEKRDDVDNPDLKFKDLTFKQLYKRTGKELCVMVTNLNDMDCMYCHVKTTPDMPIRKAVQMSSCIPGLFCPVKLQKGNKEDYCIDGGLLSNFPIHCFDGWYLSMERKDSFLKQLQRVDEIPALWRGRFSSQDAAESSKNAEKTLGVLLYANDEREVMKEPLLKRFKKHIKTSEKCNLPKTRLARKRKSVMKKAKLQMEEHHKLKESFRRLCAAFDLDSSETINLEKFKEAMEKTNSEFTTKDKKRLFGDSFDAKGQFNRLDTDNDGEISLQELMAFGESKGLKIMDHFRGYRRTEITDLRSYFGTILDSLLLNMKRIFVQSSDVNRTIGINTGYLDTLDFKMENGDKTYIVQQGKLGCVSFLRELIDEQNMVRTAR